MTSESIVDPTMQNGDASAPPKKRRRRAAATGAADDCFTCRKSQTKCDRRRPYCGQCLEFGKDCSGYKTTLTWGVGVASRGKLRGLTCPVAKQSVGERTGPKSESKAPSIKPETAGKQPAFNPSYAQDFTNGPSATPASVHEPTRKVKVEPGYERHLSLSQSAIVHSPDWDHRTPRPAVPGTVVTQQPQSSSHNPEESLPPHIHTSFIEQSSEGTAFPRPAGSMSSTFSNDEFHGGADYPLTPASLLQYGDALAQYSTNAFAVSDQQQQIQQQDLSKGRSSFNFGDSMGGPATLFTPASQYHQQDMNAETQYSTEYDSLSGLDPAGNNFDPQQLLDGDLNFPLTLPRSLSFSQFFHLSPRMQFLMDYYDKHICSVLVAFDSPSNPYRQHVLELATHNEGLQNAIAALAINNMRMRNQRPPSMGFVEEIDDYGADTEDHSQPTPEESLYKNVSVAQLQMQLADPRNAQDDSILATLLILCLFHVCDSGFSKFKTQLEGVQKLLSMRDRSVRTGFIGWVEMFFTWFDVMTSTVNDRETEIRGDRLDMMQYSSNLGALEQFSGCDGRLFKIIARLGRLNLLSQNRTVKSQRVAEQIPRPHPPPRRFRAFGPAKGQKRRMVDPAEFIKLDGNGWGSILTSSSDEEDDTPDAEKSMPGADTRHEFWAEWSDIRARLQTWSMSEPLPGDDIAIRSLDMMHINEMFRSSALLYTERLAYPHMPSASPNFQMFVRETLTHITAIPVTSCVNKFLLWPLFITGTECIEAHDRANVRERCIEIQRESGFYNNISVLQVLERVWAEQGEESFGGEIDEVRRRRKDSSAEKGGFGQAFRWRKAMDRMDGEYIIV